MAARVQGEALTEDHSFNSLCRRWSRSHRWWRWGRSDWHIDGVGVLDHLIATRLDNVDVNAVAVSQDGQLAAIAADTRDVQVYSTTGWGNTATLTGHGSEVYSTAFVGQELLAGGDDNVVRVWSRLASDRAGAGTTDAVLCDHGKDVFAIATTPDGTIVASGGEGQVVHLSDATSRRDVRLLAHFPDDVTALAVTSDGRTLVVGLEDGTVDLRDITRTIANDSSPLRQGVPAENLVFWDQQLVTSGEDEKVRIWDLRTGAVVSDFVRT